MKLRSGSGRRGSSQLVFDGLVPSRLVLEQMPGHDLPRKRGRLPFRALGSEYRIVKVNHPQVAASPIVVDEPHTGRVALPFLRECLQQRPEEAVDVGLADEEIHGELHDVGLNLREALGAAPLDVFANQRGAQDVRIVGIERQRGRSGIVTFHSTTVFCSDMTSPETAWTQLSSRAARHDEMVCTAEASLVQKS